MLEKVEIFLHIVLIATVLASVLSIIKMAIYLQKNDVIKVKYPGNDIYWILGNLLILVELYNEHTKSKDGRLGFWSRLIIYFAILNWSLVVVVVVISVASRL